MDNQSVYSNFTEEEFQRFISEKLPEIKCTSCGHKNFTSAFEIENEISRPSLVEYRKSPNHKIVGLYEFIPLVCDNCSTTILLSAHLIQKWVNKNLRDV